MKTGTLFTKAATSTECVRHRTTLPIRTTPNKATAPFHEWAKNRLLIQSGPEFLSMAEEDRSEVLRNQIEELREEAAALVDRAKKTARHADDLAARIKNLENQLIKKKH
jgi:hypothetical protein